MTSPILEISGATLKYGERQIWSDLNLEVAEGEFIAVIGANGSGKTALLRSILGLVKLDAGTIKLAGQEIRAGHPDIGYIPQHRAIEPDTPLLARDLLRFGIDGGKFGLPLPAPKAKQRVTAMLSSIEAEHLAGKPVGQLSGGEFQRLRVGQALINQPKLILADEPLSALDLHQQGAITDLIDQQRRVNNSSVLFVTHDVNPILNQVNRVLYLANGRFKIGTPDEVLRSEVLSDLYETPVDVLRNQGRIVVVGNSHDHDHFDGEVWSR